MEDVIGEGKDLGKIPELGKCIGVKNLVPLREEGERSGVPTSESGLEALHSVVPRELEGGGDIRCKENPIQLKNRGPLLSQREGERVLRQERAREADQAERGSSLESTCYL